MPSLDVQLYSGKTNGAPPDESFAKGARGEIERRLALPSTSPAYAEALKKKLEVYVEPACSTFHLDKDHTATSPSKSTPWSPSTLKSRIARSPPCCGTCANCWIALEALGFLGNRPSIVDAELAPLLARLRKPTVQKGEIIKEAGMSDYADMLLATPQWQAVGRQN